MSNNSQQQESSGWGSWGSWLSSTVDNVMSTVTETTNKIGSTIQDTITDITTAPPTPPTPVSQENTTTPDQQQNQTPPAQQKSLIDEAEETFNNLIGSVVEGSKKLAEAEEVKFVSAMANNLAQQTKEATTKLITQISDGTIVDSSKNVIDNLKKQAISLITGEPLETITDVDIQFQELFEQNKGFDTLNMLNGMSKQFEMLASKVAPEKAEQMKEIIALLKQELANSKFDLNSTIPSELPETNAGKDIARLSQIATELSTNLEAGITELVNTSTNSAEATKHGLLFIDKAKVDGYRLLCKLALQVIAHFGQSTEEIGSKKSYNIPSGFIPANFTPEQDKKKLAEQTVQLLSNYLLLVMKQIKLISESVKESTDKIVNIVKQKQGITEEEIKSLETKKSATVVDVEVKSTAALEYIHEAQTSFVVILQSAFLVGE